ncbi:MAG: response regulator transcription factor [Clostridiales bacterium]|nr:response regulator transcription factor [Clostridiales bacterium]
MRAVIIDDEKNAAMQLYSLIEDYAAITVVNIFTDPCEGLRWLIKESIDLLFLDIDMPNISGIYIAELLSELQPEIKICFVTAFDDFAIKAFEINALDYILKPCTKERLNSCISKLARISMKKKELEVVSDSSPYDLDIICGYDNENIVLLNYSDIYYIETVQGGTEIHCKDTTYRGNKALSFYEDKLKKKSFFRTHKCYLVNLSKVDKFRPRINYTYDMFFRESKEIVPVSRNKVRELKAVFNTF